MEVLDTGRKEVYMFWQVKDLNVRLKCRNLVEKKQG